MPDALIIPADINKPVRTEAVNGLEAIKSVVGGWIEGVRLNTNTYCYVNEEGKLTGLTRNGRATVFSIALNPAMASDFIAGDMVVFGGGDSEGEDTDVDPKHVVMMKLCDFAREVEAGEIGTCTIRIDGFDGDIDGRTCETIGISTDSEDVSYQTPIEATPENLDVAEAIFEKAGFPVIRDADEGTKQLNKWADLA